MVFSLIDSLFGRQNDHQVALDKRQLAYVEQGFSPKEAQVLSWFLSQQGEFRKWGLVSGGALSFAMHRNSTYITRNSTRL